MDDLDRKLLTRANAMASLTNVGKARRAHKERVRKAQDEQKKAQGQYDACYEGWVKERDKILADLKAVCRAEENAGGKR